MGNSKIQEFGCVIQIIILLILPILLSSFKYAYLGFNEVFSHVGIFYLLYLIAIPSILYSGSFIIVYSIVGIFFKEKVNAVGEFYLQLLPRVAQFSLWCGLIAETVAYLCFNVDLMETIFEWLDS